jgi:hypothetical protein
MTDVVFWDTLSTVASTSTAVSNRAGEVGMGYVQHPLYTVRSLAFDSQGRFYPNSTTGTAQYYLVPTPLHADVEVSTWIDTVTALTTGFPGPCARCHPTANTMVIARLNAGTSQIELMDLVAGVATTIGTFSLGSAWTAGSVHKLTVRVTGNQASALVDDVQVIAPVTTAVTANNPAAIRMSAGAGMSATAGHHITEIEVLDNSGLGAPPNKEPAAWAPPQATTKSLTTTVNQRNQLNNSYNPVWTHNSNLYAVWATGNDRRPIIGKRALPSGSWSTFDLSTVAGNPLVVPTLEDSHNTYSVGVSGDGRIHVSGNLHDVAQRYVRSTNPEDITAWTTTTSPPSFGSTVTYPEFAKLPDGDLLYFLRNGSSGNGDFRVCRYDSTTQTWGSVVVFVSGVAASESPYINHPAIAPDGTIHIFYCWRSASGGGNDNQDICHIKSADGGATWTDMAGNALTLSITHATSPVIVDTAASGSGLLNTCGADVDTAGHPHAAFFLYDANGFTQVHHIYHDGAAWQNVQVTNWGYRHNLAVGVVDSVIARPQVICPDDGSTWLLLRHNVDKAGRLYLIDVTPGAGSGVERVVWNAPSYYGEIHGFDRPALLDRDELRFLVAPAAPVAPSNADMPLVQWQAVSGYEVTVPLAQFANLPVLTSPQSVLPDADTDATGWATAPLSSKVNDSSDLTLITGALS